MVHVVVNGKWHLLIRAIDRAGRRIDEVTCLIVPARFENIEKPPKVAFKICMRVDEGIPHACLGSQIDDAGKLIFGEQLVDCVGVLQGNLPEVKIWKLFQQIKPRVLEADVVIVIEVVDPSNRIAEI